MSYRVGMSVGEVYVEPAIVCDNCEDTYRIANGKGPREWFLKKKPPPKWRGFFHKSQEGLIRRFDFCTWCKAAYAKALKEYPKVEDS